MNNNMQPIDEDELKNKLKPNEYYVLREGGTEEPFSGTLLHEKSDGTYVCKACGNKLFESTAKFDSGTGWPSFDEAIPGSITLNEDKTAGMLRTEVKCAQCGSHLGHLFYDGPTNTGKRFCLNSVCLDLEDKK